MSAESLEERFKLLEKEVERLQAYNEIQTLVGKYVVLHTPQSMARTPEEVFALKQPDVSVEVAMWGIFVGPEQVKKVYGSMEEGQTKIGSMFEHQFTTPMIEVAGDGKTAKGLWYSPGHETPIVDGKPQAKWCWGRYSGDFIKEDGKWKIWHFHFYDTFMIPFEKSWVDTPQPGPEIVSRGLRDMKPDKPTTYRSSYWPTAAREPYPSWPEPYQTWDGKSMV